MFKFALRRVSYSWIWPYNTEKNHQTLKFCQLWPPAAEWFNSTTSSRCCVSKYWTKPCSNLSFGKITNSCSALACPPLLGWQFGQFGFNGFKRGQTHMHGLWSIKVSQNRPQTLMHIKRRFVKSLYNMWMNVGTVITVSVPKCTSNIDAYFKKIWQICV